MQQILYNIVNKTHGVILKTNVGLLIKRLTFSRYVDFPEVLV